jgi:pantetheine-phosphate adenylyltransferase
LTIAVYPGSFDPFTNGHLDIATRAAKLFEKLIVGIYATPEKNLLFTTKERLELARKSINLPNVEVVTFEGLTVDFAMRMNAKTLVRGLRINADFEFEFDMAMMNKKLNPDLELICLMATAEYQFVSSSLLKEIAKLGGNINEFVPPPVAEALRKKFPRRQNKVTRG